jgi:alpha-ribazole phosphatase CobZ
VENRDIAEKVFKRELKLALSDPNLCILLYAGILLEKEGEKGELPGMSKETFDKDLTYLIVDEVIGMSIAKYISGDKGIFEYVRFDKLKPGILAKLGPFMDDVIAGLIGGASANMYSRGKDDGGKVKKTFPRKRQSGFAG